MSRFTIVMVRAHSHHDTRAEAVAAMESMKVQPGTSVYVVMEAVRAENDAGH
jgi:hypothetical protein